METSFTNLKKEILKRATSNAKVRAFDDASVSAFGNAKVRATDNAKVEAFDDAYITSYSLMEVVLHENSIYRVRKSNTVYFSSDNLIFKKQT